MRFELINDADAFHARAWPLLESCVENNILATVVQSALAGHYRESPPLFAVGLGDGGEVAVAALRTPPWRMLCTELPAGTARPLLAAWLEHDSEPAGVSGPPSVTRALAEAWRELTGGAAECELREAMYATSEIVGPTRPAPGALRRATAADRELLLGWTRGFLRDSGMAAAEEATAMVERGLDGRRLWIWEDPLGTPVSYLGITEPVAGVARVGPVYTPPELRGRGYATTAVAALSRRALSRGARTCMLLADLANPTANRIYASIGYRRRGDWEEHSFK